MNILVTGANGFIGRAWIQWLAKKPYHVSALDLRFSPGSFPRNVKSLYVQDITKKFKIDQSFDFVFHLAACNLTHVDKAGHKEYYRVNVRGTENVINAVRTRNFIFLSTAKVYKINGRSVREAGALAPRGDYEKSKLKAENICRKHFPGNRLTILRAVNVVGPGQPEKAVVPVFFRNAFQNAPLKIIGSRKNVFQFVFLKDLLQAFNRILSAGKGQGTLNISSDQAVTLRTLAEKVMALCRSKSEVVFDSDDEVLFAKVLSKKAEERLGWKARTSTNTMLKECYGFYKRIYG